MKQQLNENIIKQEYQQALVDASKAFNLDKPDKGISHAKYAARIAWDYPIHYKFCDEQLEKIIIDGISSRIKPMHLDMINNDTVVYYCSWLGDNNALIEQYLYYFIESNIKTILIVPNHKETAKTNLIKKRLSLAKNVSVYYLESKSAIKKIEKIREIVKSYIPGKIFLHLWPNDVVGFASFVDIYGTKRYFINHGDHVFWLGKNSADYFIEYRKFGIALTSTRRGIDASRILHIPFYPINNGISFKGFPFSREGKIVIVSGANLYKYYLDPEMNYFKTIAGVFKEHKNACFCLCGNGDPEKIREVFIENDIENQFYFLGQRDDFYQLIGKADIMVESYPVKGGLTMLFAIEQMIPVIGITTNHNASGSIQDFLGIDAYKEPTTLDEFSHLLKILIQEKDARKSLAVVLSKNDWTKDLFTKKLDLLITDRTESLMVINEKYELTLNTTDYLNAYLNLPTATIQDLFHNKLFILKKHLSIIKRLNILKILLKRGNKVTLKYLLRSVFLSFTGY